MPSKIRKKHLMSEASVEEARKKSLYRFHNDPRVGDINTVCMDPLSWVVIQRTSDKKTFVVTAEPTPTYVVRRSGSGADVQCIGKSFFLTTRRDWHMDAYDNAWLNKVMAQAESALKKEIEIRPALERSEPGMMNLRPQVKSWVKPAPPKMAGTSGGPISWAAVAKCGA